MTKVSIYIRKEQTGFTPGIVPYMHKEDKAIRGYIRTCAPCPAVWILHNDGHVFLNKQWQYYIIAINSAMLLENIYLLLDNHLAFANRTGFSSLANPDRIDYFFNRLNYAKYPQLDKVRTCSRASVTGFPEYSVVQALKDTKNVLQARTRSWRGVQQALTVPNVLNIRTFDSRKPPPLALGKHYPARIEDIDIDDYQFNPRYNREMFLVANIVNKRGDVVQFPRGGLYSWTGDGTTYSFLPHISNHGFGAVRPPLDNFIKLPKNSPVPSPYRRSI